MSIVERAARIITIQEADETHDTHDLYIDAKWHSSHPSYGAASAAAYDAFGKIVYKEQKRGGKDAYVKALETALNGDRHIIVPR